MFQVQLAFEEKCEFMPFLSPKNIEVKDGKIVCINFCRTEQNENGEWLEDPEQLVKLKVNYIISAFGSTLSDPESEWSTFSISMDSFKYLSNLRTIYVFKSNNNKRNV